MEDNVQYLEALVDFIATKYSDLVVDADDRQMVSYAIYGPINK